MVASALIYDVENPEARVSNSRHQQQVCSHTVVQVLMGLLVVFTLVVAGGVFWIKTSQDHPQHIWPVRITGENTSFTSPRTQKYSILAKLSTEGKEDDECIESFQLLQNPSIGGPITVQNSFELFMVYDVELQEGSTLSIEFNCKGMKIDETKSMMIVFQQNN